MTRILALILQVPEVGGAEKQLLEIGKYFKSARNQQVVFVFIKRSDSKSLLPLIEEEGIDYRILNLPLQTHFLPFSILRLSFFFLTHRITHVIAFLELPGLISAIAGRLAGIKTHIWGIRSSKFNIQKGKLFNWALKRSNYLVCNSDIGRKEFSQFLPISQKFNNKLLVIPNAVPLAQCELPISNRKEGEKQIAMVANFKQPKDYLGLMKVFKLLNKMEPDSFHLHLIGRGTERILIDYPEFSDLTPLISSTGYVKDVSHYLIGNKIEVGILMSHFEGQPNAILDFMKCGIPVVASDLEGIREVISEENKSYLFPNDQYQLIASAIQDLSTDPKLRASLIKANYKKLSDHHNAFEIGSRYQLLLEN